MGYSWLTPNICTFELLLLQLKKVLDPYQEGTWEKSTSLHFASDAGFRKKMLLMFVISWNYGPKILWNIFLMMTIDYKFYTQVENENYVHTAIKSICFDENNYIKVDVKNLLGFMGFYWTFYQWKVDFIIIKLAVDTDKL